MLSPVVLRRVIAKKSIAAEIIGPGPPVSQPQHLETRTAVRAPMAMEVRKDEYVLSLRTGLMTKTVPGSI